MLDGDHGDDGNDDDATNKKILVIIIPHSKIPRELKAGLYK